MDFSDTILYNNLDVKSVKYTVHRVMGHKDTLSSKQLEACSAKKRDNLLVEMSFFAIFGVSFFVTQNPFNFIEIRNNNKKEQFSKYFIPLCFHFF